MSLIVPDFKDIPEPLMVGLFVGNGSGSKLFQSFLDNHSEILLIPGYPLTYLYPHWETWKEELKFIWNWDSLIDKFCDKHASVIDTRKIPGLGGLTTLGKTKNEYLCIDENEFRNCLSQLLENREINTRNFILAIHYAYAICNGEDVFKKKMILFHIHVLRYLTKFLLKDFPELKALGMVRDPRLNLFNRYRGSFCNVNKEKLNQTDAFIYKNRTYLNACEMVFDELNSFHLLPYLNVRMIRHEDMGNDIENLMKSVAAFLDIDCSKSMLCMTYGGKEWWGVNIYEKKITNKFNPEVLDLKWQAKLSGIDIFVTEGILCDYINKYTYRKCSKYKKDNFINRLFLVLAIMLPSRIELILLKEYCNPTTHIQFIKACHKECTGKLELKDYTQNSSYLYRWAYLDLKLQKQRLSVSLLKDSKLAMKNSPDNRLTIFRYISTYIFYLIARYCHFLWSIISFPVLIFKRSMVLYLCLYRRLKAKSVLPDSIQKN